MNLKTSTLRGAIVESLSIAEMTKTLADNLMDGAKTYARHKCETDYWEYKQNLDLNNPGNIADLAKWILAFHNAKGGVLVAGVNNTNFKLEGIDLPKIPDRVAINNKVKGYFPSSIMFFTDQIKLSNGKALLLIFVPKKEGKPLAAAKSWPENADEQKLIICRNSYYVRINDECKKCVNPDDYEVLFSGVSPKNLQAYLYAVDDPFFRLLSPHQHIFVPRNAVVSAIEEALNGRHFIVALEGLGGVGKSAIAIEIVRKYYQAKKYQFIVSLSAKNNIWQKNKVSRQAHFSGYTEFLHEIAKVLDLQVVGGDNDYIRELIFEHIKDIPGLFFVDNAETIQDQQITEFLENVPAPTKILLTSRISRGLGAKSISIPAMTIDESRTLLRQELERVHYFGYVNEERQMDEIIKAAGCLPLAIKWAAELARTSQSLVQVSTSLRSKNSSGREFTEFCFSSMYDQLSEIARDIALLCPLLREEWSSVTLSLLLNKDEDYIDEAIRELEDRQILLTALPSNKQNFSLLPLTMDFLENKMHESKSFREKVSNRINNIIPPDFSGNLFSWDKTKRIEKIYDHALYLCEAQKKFKEAESLIRLGLQWYVPESHILYNLPFLRGRIMYRQNAKTNGIAIMKSALCQTRNIASNNDPDNSLFLAEAMLEHGQVGEITEALDLVLDNFDNINNNKISLIEKFCQVVIDQNDKKRIVLLAEKIKDSELSYRIAEYLRKNSSIEEKKKFISSVEREIVSLYSLASKYGKIAENDKNYYINKGLQIRSMADQHKAVEK